MLYGLLQAAAPDVIESFLGQPDEIVPVVHRLADVFNPGHQSLVSSFIENGAGIDFGIPWADVFEHCFMESGYVQRRYRLQLLCLLCRRWLGTYRWLWLCRLCFWQCCYS